MLDPNIKTPITTNPNPKPN